MFHYSSVIRLNNMLSELSETTFKSFLRCVEHLLKPLLKFFNIFFMWKMKWYYNFKCGDKSQFLLFFSMIFGANESWKSVLLDSENRCSIKHTTNDLHSFKRAKRLEIFIFSMTIKKYARLKSTSEHCPQ